MALFRVFLSFFLLVPTLPAALGPVGPAEVYQESGGIVVMEAERTPSSLGTGANRWELYNPGETNYVVGATNEGQIEFQGNSSNGGDPKTPLTYKFKINQSGYYHLHLRARARLDGVETDKNNDCYVKVGGASFGAGPNAGNSHLMDAPLALLTTDTKMYGASATTWGWANELDAGGNNNKRFPVYNFSAGSTYTLTISGRSLHYNIDRVVFRQSTIAAASAKSASIPESSTTAGSGATTQSIAALILVNADTDDDIGPITNGAVINLAATGANLNIRAATSPSIIGSVRFSLDGVSDFMTQSSVPYTLGGDLAGDDYLAWTPTLGSHTLTATPYDAAAGGGTAGTPLTLNFTVVNQTATGTPVANAGADQSIRLPTGSVTLNGSGTDSGGSISGHVWTQVSGPGTATLSGAATANLTASALVQGAYIFRLTVTDNSGLTASDDAIVNVAAAAAGSGQSVVTLMLIDADTDGDLGPISNGNTIDLAVTGANLNIRADTAPTTVGSVRFSYDDVPNYMTQSGTPYTIGGDSLTDYLPWTPALGTHTVTATPYTASAGGGIAGTPKTVVFTVINSQLSGNPLVNAGGDKTISLPASSVVFNGTASDGEGPISSYAWSQVSGPGTAVLAGSTTPNLTASSLVHGSYVFRLTVSDNSGLTASDEVTAHVLPATSGDATLSGELKKWHKVTLNFTGPTTSETATPNPFTDYRLNVTFSHPTTGKTFVVPGYFAADGNAANTSATSGAVWRVHFAPDETGAWTYTASFRSGSNIATTTAAGTSAGFFDGDTGNFSIAPTDKTGRDFRGKGRLEYVGKHHLRFAETGEFS